MALEAYLAAWSGSALRHIPAGRHYHVLDFRSARRGQENRWNEPGEPTLYLAGDEGVLVGEWGRHLNIDRTPSLARKSAERSVYRLTLALDRVLDLRDSAIRQALGLTDPPYVFLEVAVARATARYIRIASPAQAILVPSVAFLDDPTRYNLIVFLDKLPTEPREWISHVELLGPLRWG